MYFLIQNAINRKFRIFSLLNKLFSISVILKYRNKSILFKNKENLLTT